MDKISIQFIADNFSYEYFSNEKTTRTKLPSEKDDIFVVLEVRTQYDSIDHVNFILSDDIRDQEPNKITDDDQIFACEFCEEECDEEYYEQIDTGGAICSECYENYKNAMIIHKQDTVFIDTVCERDPLYVKKGDSVIHVWINNINPVKILKMVEKNAIKPCYTCSYCRSNKNLNKVGRVFEKNIFSNYFCNDCLKHYELAALMNKKNFFIYYIQVLNILHRDLKQPIINLMLKTFAY